MYKIFLTAAVIILTAVLLSEPSSANTPSSNFIETERNCLATTIYREARGESLRGQVLVAETVINRTKNEKYSSRS